MTGLSSPDHSPVPNDDAPRPDASDPADAAEESPIELDEGAIRERAAQDGAHTDSAV